MKNDITNDKAYLEKVETMINNIKLARVARDPEKGYRLFSPRIGARVFNRLLWVRSALQAKIAKHVESR